MIDRRAYAAALPIFSIEKIGVGEGRAIAPLGIPLQWKATGSETGYAFCAYETTIAPDVTIPMHNHPHAEFFYLLRGAITLIGLDRDGNEVQQLIREGECFNVRANTPHGLRNDTKDITKLLHVSTFEHEQVFSRFENTLLLDENRNISTAEQILIFNELAENMGAHNFTN